MADIYIIATAFAFPPNRKQADELRAAWPQIDGFTASPDSPIFVNGSQQPPGYVIHTSNPAPDPDEAAIIADAIAFSDGSAYPDRFGVAIPLVNTAADLPAQPPIPSNQAMLAAVRTAPDSGLWVYVEGPGWIGPIAP